MSELIKMKQVGNTQGTIHKEINEDYIIEVIEEGNTLHYGIYNKFDYTYTEVENILDDKLDEYSQ